MSDLSDNKPAVTESATKVADLGSSTQSPSKGAPIKIWAFFGGAILLLQLYVWTKWVTGPYFEQVPAGPTPLPLHMKIPLIANAVVLWVALPFAVYYFFIRPWRRERRITLDGMLVLSMGLMFFQDPFLNYFNTWCTYNTWLFNRGAWTPHIPGWFSPDEPGRMVPEPLLTNTVGYAYGVLLITIIGCAVMRKIKSRWPNITNLRLILATFAIAFVFDFVMEALVLLPTGLYTYPGAIRAVSFNAGTYYQWPVYEGAHVGRRPDSPVLSALLHRRSWPHHRRARVGPGARRLRPTAVRSLPGDLRCGERLLLRLVQHSRAVVRHALRPLARGPFEALVFQRRHLWRRNRHPLPRPRSAATEQMVRLTSTPTVNSFFRRAPRCRRPCPSKRGK